MSDNNQKVQIVRDLINQLGLSSDLMVIDLKANAIISGQAAEPLKHVMIQDDGEPLNVQFKKGAVERALKKVKGKKAKLGRTERIRQAVAKAKKGLTLSQLVRAIGETSDETKFVAATALRLFERKEIKRKQVDGHYVYTVA